MLIGIILWLEVSILFIQLFPGSTPLLTNFRLLTYSMFAYVSEFTLYPCVLTVVLLRCSLTYDYHLYSVILRFPFLLHIPWLLPTLSRRNISPPHHIGHSDWHSSKIVLCFFQLSTFYSNYYDSLKTNILTDLHNIVEILCLLQVDMISSPSLWILPSDT